MAWQFAFKINWTLPTVPTIDSDVIFVQCQVAKTISCAILIPFNTNQNKKHHNFKRNEDSATVFLKNERTLVIVQCKNALQCPRPLFCSVSSQNQTHHSLWSRQYKASRSMGYICKCKKMQFELFTTHYFINSTVDKTKTWCCL